MVLGKDVRPRPEYGTETAPAGLNQRDKGIKSHRERPVKVVPDGHVTLGFERSVQITHGSNTQVTLKSHLVSVPTNLHISANALICGTIPTSYHCLSFTLFVLSPVLSVLLVGTIPLFQRGCLRHCLCNHYCCHCLFIARISGQTQDFRSAPTLHVLSSSPLHVRA